MKRLLILTALLPFAALAQPLNTLNNPNQQGYVIPSQQRMQTEMMSQQQQQKGCSISSCVPRPRCSSKICKTR